MARRFAYLRRHLRYGPRDLWHLVRNPVGRGQLRTAAAWLVFPLAALAAGSWRRVVLRRTPVIAIVGSFGKTTTTRAVALALGVPPPPRANCSTPLALAVLRHRPGRPLVVETGISRPGQMRAYARMLRPDVTVVTSIGSEHRGSLGPLARTQFEKGWMLQALAPGGVAVLNGDDPGVMAMAGRAGGRRQVRVGFEAANDIRAEQVRMDWPTGTDFMLVAPGWQAPARVGLVGRHLLRAPLAAVAVASELGVEPAAIVERLAALEPVPARLQPVTLPGGAVVLRDDLKSGLETIDAALATLAEVPAPRRLVVLGDITEPEKPLTTTYRELGRRVGQVAHRVFYLGHHAGQLRSGAAAAGLASERVSEHGDVLELADAVARELRAGDVVLIKGRLDQKLGRVALALAGRPVGCRLKSCRARGMACERCPVLETGWGSLQPVT